MENIIKVAVDAMGGDYAPTEAVKGAVAALQERENVQIFLVGKREILEKELESCTYPEERPVSYTHLTLPTTPYV